MIGTILWVGVVVRAGFTKKALVESRLGEGRYRISGTSDSKSQTHKPTLFFFKLNETRELDTKECLEGFIFISHPSPF